MAVPKKRRSHTRQAKRRANHFLKTKSLTTCVDCGEPTLPHRICPSCNKYKGKRFALLAE